MKLYSSWSPNPQKVHFALEELGLTKQIVEIELFRGEQRSESFTALNPMQKVPVLEDNGFVLWESNAILAYLEERENRLWPTDGRARADALRWMFFEARHLAESIGALWFFESIAPTVGVPPDTEAISRGRKELEHPMTVVEKRLSTRAWILGAEFSLVDCCIGTQLAALTASQFDWTAYSASKSYVAKIRERNGWRATNPRY